MLTGSKTAPKVHVTADFAINSASSLEAAYHRLIPISRHMGIHVLEYTGEALKLAAPLAENINHQGSAFGGSLFSIAALAGWGILQLKFSEMGIDCNTVIGKGEVEYTRPVFEAFECACALPKEYPAFEQALASNGKSRLTLTATVSVAGEPAMILTGQYFVSRVAGQA